jgi:chromosome segregation ATPase
VVSLQLGSTEILEIIVLAAIAIELYALYSHTKFDHRVDEHLQDTASHLDRSDTLIQSLDAQLTVSDERMIRLDEHINVLDRRMDNFDDHLHQLDTHINDLDRQMGKLDEHLIRFDEHINRLDDFILRMYTTSQTTGTSSPPNPSREKA